MRANHSPYLYLVTTPLEHRPESLPSVKLTLCMVSHGTYHGTPHTCGSTLRHISNHRCVECQRDQHRLISTDRRIAKRQAKAPGRMTPSRQRALAGLLADVTSEERELLECVYVDSFGYADLADTTGEDEAIIRQRCKTLVNRLRKKAVSMEKTA